MRTQDSVRMIGLAVSLACLVAIFAADRSNAADLDPTVNVENAPLLTNGYLYDGIDGIEYESA